MRVGKSLVNCHGLEAEGGQTDTFKCAIIELPFTSVSKRGFLINLCYENEFDLLESVDGTYFHRKFEL